MQTCRTLGESEARIAIEACLADLARRGKAATIAVADSHGELIALWRMDGANLPSIVIAGNKAYTAARVRADSGEMGRDVKSSGDDAHYHGDARYVGWDGGAVVRHDGEVLGAVAVSGLSGEEDIAIARVGVDAILQALD
jgi:glc operon protein GlcG